MEYDLLSETWIPVADRSGPRKVGLIEALARAHQLGIVCASSPLVTFGIYRLLIGVVHWLLPVPTLDEWKERCDRGLFSDDLVASLRQRGAGKFDLFDLVRPFYQRRSADSLNPKKWKPASYLDLAMPTKTFINHFWHVYDGDFAEGRGFCPACCAEGLLSFPPFAPKGGHGIPQSINGKPPVYALPIGSNLFSTIMLSLPVAELNGLWDPPIPGDRPEWEGAPRRSSAPGSAPVGLLEGLTWQPRRAHLMPRAVKAGQCMRCRAMSAILVGRVALPPGGESRGPKESARPWSDPHALGKDDRTLSPFPSRSFWRRRLEALLQFDPSESLHTPPVIRQLQELVGSGRCPARPIQVRFYETAVKQAALTNWNEGAWTLSPAVLASDKVRRDLLNALRLADSLANKVRKALRPPVSDNPALCQLESAFQQAVEGRLATVGQGRNDVSSFLQDVGRDFRLAAEQALGTCAPLRPAVDRWRRAEETSSFALSIGRILQKGGAS